MRGRVAFCAGLALLTLGIVGCGSPLPATGTDGPPAQVSSRPSLPSTAPGLLDGVYLDFATCDPDTPHRRSGTTQVYFFTSKDCPACQRTDATLLAGGIPAGLTVFKVDLPTMPELAARYGVTAPDTFVQVDVAGRKVRSWIGSTNGAEIAAHAS